MSDLPKFQANIKPSDFSEASPKDVGHQFYETWIKDYWIDKEKGIKKPMVITCLIIELEDANNPIIHRGYAVCGLQDNPFNDYGSLLSESRALDAMKLKSKVVDKKRCAPMLREEVIEVLSKCHREDLIGKRKGQHNVSLESLTEFERKLVDEFFED